MAVSVTNQAAQIGTYLVQDTDADETGQTNTTGTTGTLYYVELDNTANAAASYVKLYDSAGPITVGTTVPDIVLKVAASVSRGFVLPGGGLAFTSGFSHAVVTAGGTAGTTGPTSAATLRYITS